MARTRSKEVHDRILHAALGLFSERGFESTSMDAIAQQAGVSKPTLYNHWVDKEALMMDVMLYVNGIVEGDRRVPQTGGLEGDLSWVLTRKPPDEFAEVRERMMPGLIAYSVTHPQFGSAWRNNVMEPARRALRTVLRRGIRKRELAADLDVDVALCFLLGPMLYRHVFVRVGKPDVDELGEHVAAAFCRAFRRC